MHYSTDHKALLPAGFAPLPMPDTRFEALWLLLCLKERRRMLPCQVGHPSRGRYFQAADHIQQVSLGSNGNLDS